MAKRSKPKNDGSIGVKPKEPEKPAVETSTEKVILIPLIAVYPSILKYTSQATGQLYVWNGAGDVQQVDSRDVQTLLEKRIGNRGCCGSANKDGNKVFELFELKEAA